MTREIQVESEQAMLELGTELASEFCPGTIVLLSGNLGAGKTTLVRGVLSGLGYNQPVRSPTYNLLQVFDTHPPVLHVDLYRVESAEGLGIEDYMESHICLIEWPDRWAEIAGHPRAIHIQIDFIDAGRKVTVNGPARPVQS